MAIVKNGLIIVNQCDLNSVEAMVALQVSAR